MDDANERYKLTLFVNNLFDESYALNITGAGGALWFGGAPGANIVGQLLPRGAQRYAGVKFKVSI